MQDSIDIQLQEQGIPFGKYRLIAKLAVGGMAELFVARQQGLGGFSKTVAVKCILPYFARDREFISMFLGEARLAAHLNHPNVVQIQDVGDVDGVFFMVMEYIPGQNLKSFAKRLFSLPANREEPPYALISSLFVQALHGLSHVHNATDENQQHLHLVHRDISPNNLMLSYDGNVKIVDFGVAKAKTQESETQVGVLKGRLSYMSPEHLSGQPLDGRSDIFAMGVVLYELTTNRRLFKRRSEAETMQALMTSPIPPPSRLYPDFPTGLEALLMTSLNRDPNKRFQTADEMRDALEDWLMEYDQSVLGTRHLVSIMEELFSEEKQDERNGIYPKPVTQNDLMNLARGSYRVMEDGSIFTYFAPPGASQEFTPPTWGSAQMMPLVQGQSSPPPTSSAGPPQSGHAQSGTGSLSPYGSAGADVATAQHRAVSSESMSNGAAAPHHAEDEPTSSGSYPGQSSTPAPAHPIARDKPLETSSYSLSDEVLGHLERGDMPHRPFAASSPYPTVPIPEHPGLVAEIDLEDEEEVLTDSGLAAASDDDPPTSIQALPAGRYAASTEYEVSAQDLLDEPIHTVAPVAQPKIEWEPQPHTGRPLAEPDHLIPAVPVDIAEQYNNQPKSGKRGLGVVVLVLLLLTGGGVAWWFLWGPGHTPSTSPQGEPLMAVADAGALAGHSSPGLPDTAASDISQPPETREAPIPEREEPPPRPTHRRFVMHRVVVVRRPQSRTRQRIVRQRIVRRVVRRIVRRPSIRPRTRYAMRRLPAKPRLPFSAITLERKVRLPVYEQRSGARAYTQAHPKLCRQIEREVGRIYGNQKALRGITRPWQQYVRKRFANSRRKSFVFYPRAAAYVIFRDLQRGKSFSYVSQNLVKYQKTYRFSRYRNK